MPDLPAPTARYDHVPLDLDGCVRVGETATPRAAEAVATLRAAGRGVAFVTNDPAPAPEEVAGQLTGLGIPSSAADVVTVGSAIQHALAADDRWRTAYVIGGDVLHGQVADTGVREPDGAELADGVDVVVVVADTLGPSCSGREPRRDADRRECPACPRPERSA